MSKRFDNLSHILALLALLLGATHFTTSVSFAAETYSLPQPAEATLAWDPNEPAPDGYRIHQRTEGQPYDYSQPSWTGSGTSGTLYNLEWGATYYFVVRAYAGALESPDSEDVKLISPSVNGSRYRQLLSISSDRSNPDALDGAILDGLIYAYVEPITDIKRVEPYSIFLRHSASIYSHCRD